MKVDPVFLLAPKPSSAAMPSRRAFLIAGCTFTLGTAVGGACGYSLGAEQARSPSGGSSSNDPHLDHLRWLARDGDIKALMAERLVFLNTLTKAHPYDSILWRGVERMADAILSGFQVADREVFSLWLAQVIEQGDETMTEALLPKARRLRKR